MKRIGVVRGLRIALAVAVVVLPCVDPASMVLADEIKVDIVEVVSETQKMSSSAGQMRMVWWIPTEFWKASLAQQKNMTKAQVEEFLKVVRRYTMIVVVDSKIGPFGGMTFTPVAALRKSLKITGTDGKTYTPLPEDKIDPDTKNLIGMMKPLLSNMIGPMGKNMHWFIFPSKNSKGRAICDPKVEGTFWVNLGKDKFRWRLPLGSLLPKKTCSKCAEKLNGAYKYCPWCGTKLPEVKATTRPKTTLEAHGKDKTGKPAGLPRPDPSPTPPRISAATATLIFTMYNILMAPEFRALFRGLTPPA